LIEDEISALKQSGKTIIFSTHRMEQVEEICDEIVLVNQGKKILEGTVHELKQRFKENKYKLSFQGQLTAPTIANMKLLQQTKTDWLVQFDAAHQGNQLLRHAIDQQAEVISFQEVLPTINEIFIRQVQAN
jgi:ABC-2 type transport system ATP-binding protein